MSVYTDIQSHLQRVYKPESTFTARQLFSGRNYVAESTDFLNSVKTLSRNGVIKPVQYDPMSDWGTVYRYADLSATADPKVVEATEKGEILTAVNELGTKLGQLYSRIEKLETPHSPDLSKVSKDDLIAELTKRLS